MIKKPLAQFWIPGQPRTKKNSQEPAILGLPPHFRFRRPGSTRSTTPSIRSLCGRFLSYASAGRTGELIRDLSIVKSSARLKIFPSSAYRKWERGAVKAVQADFGHRAPLGSQQQWLHVVAHFSLDRMGPKQLGGDVVGFYQAVGDMLEKAGVVDNDRWIRRWCGSSVKKDKERPGVRILIFPMDTPKKL